MGIVFGHQSLETETTQHDLKKPSVEIFQQLKAQQQILEC